MSVIKTSHCMISSAVQGNVDGAFFGTTFPHLLLMSYPGMRPQQPPDRYVPRVFGFKLNAAALAPPNDSRDAQRNDATASRVSLVLAAGLTVYGGT